MGDPPKGSQKRKAEVGRGKALNPKSLSGNPQSSKVAISGTILGTRMYRLIKTTRIHIHLHIQGLEPKS